MLSDYNFKPGLIIPDCLAFGILDISCLGHRTVQLLSTNETHFCMSWNIQILKEDDNNWPEPDRIGRQELEIVMGNEHISFTTSKIGSLLDVQSSKDPDGLRIFYYLVQVRVSEHFVKTGKRFYLLGHCVANSWAVLGRL